MSREFDRKKSTMKTLRWSNDLLAAIDAVRGAEPFSTWVFRACWEAVKRGTKNDNALYTKRRTPTD